MPIDFVDIPLYMVNELGFPNLFVAGLFATILFLLIVMIPCLVAKQTGLAFLMGGLIIIFSVSIEWIDSWVVIVQIMFVSGLATFGVLKKVFK